MSGPVRFESPAALIGAEGTMLGTSGWLTIAQDRIDAFAEVTGDRQWIHIDVDRAAAGPFGGTIAHGYLTLSLIPALVPEILVVEGVSAAVNIGVDRLRFLTPVLAGGRIRASGEIVSAVAKGPAVQLVTRITLEIDGTETPACIVDTVVRYYPG